MRISEDRLGLTSSHLSVQRLEVAAVLKHLVVIDSKATQQAQSAWKLDVHVAPAVQVGMKGMKFKSLLINVSNTNLPHANLLIPILSPHQMAGTRCSPTRARK